MKLSFIITTLLVLAVCAPASAQTALVGGTVHIGNGEVIEDGMVLLGADGKIGAVGPRASAPADVPKIDVTGKVVTPGFIDVETRLGLIEVAAVDGTRDFDGGAVDPGVAGDPIRAAFRVSDSFNPYSAVIAVQRVGGVTSVVAMPSGGLISGQGAFADLAAPRGFASIVEPFALLRVNLGHQSQRSRGTSLLWLREVFDDAKFYAANKKKFEDNRTRHLSASRLDLETLAETMKSKKPVVFSVHRASDILAVLTIAREYDLRPVISGGAEAWKVADDLAEAKVPVVLDPLDNLPFNFDMLGARSDNAALLAEAGVPVVLSVFDTHNARNLRFYAGNAVRGGLSHADALQAVTRNAAAAVGQGDTHGTLEVGKVANVVVWSADPFQPATRVESVFIRSRPVSAQTRQRELFERYRTIERRGEPAAPAPKQSSENATSTKQ